MVVLSASVLTKSGKPLLSRQYMEITRIRIEGLLAAYPKLVGTGNQHHTFIETDSVRYLYQSIDTLILLLITNKASNIVEDLETLRMLSKVVPDVAGNIMEDKVVTEEKVENAVFELIFAFDEVISVGGHREDIDMQQLKTYLEMDSQEERIHRMVQETKLEAAKDVSIRRAKELKERQKAMGNMSRMAGISGGADMGMGSMGGAGSRGGGGWGGMESPSQQSQDAPSISSPSSSISPSTFGSAQVKSVGGIAKGMKLGGGLGGKEKGSTLDALMAEDKLVQPIFTPHADSKGTSSATAIEASGIGATVPTHPATLRMEERLSAQLSREGALEQLELRGALSLTSNEEDSTKCKVSIRCSNNDSFVFQTHPKVNKAVYEKDGVIILKDTSKGFPLQRSVGVLRWSTSGSNESMLPLSVNCWPEEEGGGMMNVNIEYSLLRNMELHDLRIGIPLGGASSPKVESADGSYRFDASSGTLIWSQAIVDQSNATGSLEFNVSGGDPNAFFPLQVQFESGELFAGITVLEVLSTDGTDRQIAYGESAILCTDNYVCQ